jgi:hypothetical protein
MFQEVILSMLDKLNEPRKVNYFGTSAGIK